MTESDNSLNPEKGRDFQLIAARLLGAYFGVEFKLDYPIAIGKPSKAHRFDLVSPDLGIVGECKNHSWTATGNMPSAKMGFINEALLYLYLSAQKYRLLHRNETGPSCLQEGNAHGVLFSHISSSA